MIFFFIYYSSASGSVKKRLAAAVGGSGKITKKTLEGLMNVPGTSEDDTTTANEEEDILLGQSAIQSTELPSVGSSKSSITTRSVTKRRFQHFAQRPTIPQAPKKSKV